jgi:rhombotail lipoprotein
MKAKVLLVATLALLSSGCGVLFQGGHGTGHHASSPLVDFLYGSHGLPPTDAMVELQLPIRVGVSFLPSAGSHRNDGPSAAEREQLLAAIRARFEALPYVSEIVPIPDYYLAGGTGSVSRGNGFTQLEQLARLHRLDLYALVSYDQVVSGTVNKRSLAYLTIVGSFFVRGDRHETHTLLDLAVVDPRTRSLVMRAGGTSSLAGNTTAVDADRHVSAQRARGIELAGTAMIGNFAHELSGFEQRVRKGTAPVRVVKRAPAGGGGGSLDPAMLALLLVCLAMTMSKRHRFTRTPPLRRR